MTAKSKCATPLADLGPLLPSQAGGNADIVRALPKALAMWTYLNGGCSLNATNAKFRAKPQWRSA